MVTTLAALMDSIGGQDVNWSCVDQKLDELKVTVLNNYERITRLRMIRVNILVFVITYYLHSLIKDFVGRAVGAGIEPCHLARSSQLTI